MMLRSFAFKFLLFWMTVAGSLSATAVMPGSGKVRPKVEDVSETLDLMKAFEFCQEAFIHRNRESLRWVKWIYFKSGPHAGKLFFLNSKQLSFHSDAVLRMPGYEKLSRQEIDAKALYANNREIIFGNMFLQASFTGASYFDLVSAEALTVEEIKAVREGLSKSAKELLGGSFSYMPIPEMEASARNLEAALNANGIPVVYAKDSTSKAIVYTDGWSLGRIRRLTAKNLEDEKIWNSITESDILVMDELPREVPLCAGIITSRVTSPASHPALLMRNFGGTLSYLKGAFEDPRWQALEKSAAWVFLRAKQQGGFGDSLQIREIPDASDRDELKGKGGAITAGKSESKSAVASALPPIQDVSLFPVKDLASVIGAKAANMAFLKRHLPEGHRPDVNIGISVDYFTAFLEQATHYQTGEKLADWMDAQTLKLGKETGVAKIRSLLEEGIDAFTKSPMPTALLESIRQSVLKQIPDNVKKVRLRSSSTAEDRKDFNGAGLYNSKSADPRDPVDFEKKLKNVWSSVLNLRAYLARRRAGIPESQARMGILGNRQLKGERAKGVAIAKRDAAGNLEVVLHGFPGEELEVTNPPPGMTPESTRIGVDRYQPTKVVVNQIVPTSVMGGRALMSKAQYIQLYEDAKTAFVAWEKERGANPALQLDLEWDVIPSPRKAGEEELWVTQVREVPLPKALTLSYSYLLPAKSLAMNSNFGEQANGMLQMTGGFSLVTDLRLGKMTVEELQSRGLPFSRIEVTASDGRLFPIDVKNLKYSVKSTPWISMPPSYGTVGEKRDIEVLMDLGIKEYPSLKLRLFWTERRLSESAGHLQDPWIDLSDRVRNWDDIRVTFVADKKDFPQVNWRDFPSYNPKEALAWSIFYAGEERGPEWSFVKPTVMAPLAIQIKGEKTSVEFEGEIEDYTVTEQDEAAGGILMGPKTLFYTLHKARIQGLVPGKTLTVNRPQALVHAPAHHNFNDEYVIDLKFVEGITEAEKADLISKNGSRYLFISHKHADPDQTKFSGHFARVSEAGKHQMVDKITSTDIKIKFKNPGNGGGGGMFSYGAVR